MTWEYETDESGDFIAWEEDGKMDNVDRDAQFDVYLPADPKKRAAAINRIINSLNRSGIRP